MKLTDDLRTARALKVMQEIDPELPKLMTDAGVVAQEVFNDMLKKHPKAESILGVMILLDTLKYIEPELFDLCEDLWNKLKAAGFGAGAEMEKDA